MGLHVGVVTAEQLLRPLDGQGLHLIHALAAAVVALARVAFRVFVGQHGSHGSHHRLRNDILRRDELQVSSLTVALGLHHASHFRIILLD